MSLDALIRLQAQYNEQDREGIRQLGEGLGNILQQGGMADFEKNAMDVLREGTTPEAMQRISEMYPNMPKREIWKYASEVGKQKEAQDVKDAGISMRELILNTPREDINMEFIQNFVEGRNMSPGVEQAFIERLPKLFEFMKNTGEFEQEKTLPIGARGVLISRGGKIARGEGGEPTIYGAPPEKEVGEKAGVKEITIAQKETRAQNFIKNYGPSKDRFDRIIEITPERRLPRLSGWFRTRGLEKKKGYFSDDELNQIEQSIMTGLRIKPGVQQTINLARKNGATEKELKILLQEYLKGQP